MPSPFPGMEPYLEGEMWQEFHETLAGSIRAQLMPLLAPKYVALLAKRYVIDYSALSISSCVTTVLAVVSSAYDRLSNRRVIG